MPEVGVWWIIANALAQTFPSTETPAAPTPPAAAETPFAALESTPAAAPAANQVAETPSSPTLTRPGQTDVEVHVFADGRVRFDHRTLGADAVDRELARHRLGRPGVRVVLGADATADHGDVLKIMKILDGQHIPWAVDPEAPPEERPPDPLFPGKPGVEFQAESLAAQGITKLGTISKDELDSLKPKRFRLPQNPYGSTDFTAYTLEWGETKVGLLGITFGLLPRIQVGTNPVLDAVGVYNGSLKANILREGPADIALMAQLYHVPVNQFVRRWDERFDLGLFGESGNGEDLFTASINYVGLGAMTSLQVAEPWSVHAGAYYGRVGASGQFDFENIPSTVIPGLVDQIIPDQGSLVPTINGDIVVVRLASDVRFNRRDSLVLQYQSVVYARARAKAGFEIEQLPGQVDVQLGYGGMVSPENLRYSGIISAAWQFSWKHWEARAGVGWSATPYAWVLQPFQLAYRFGGATRGDERRILNGFRKNVRDLRKGGDAGEAQPTTETPKGTKP